MKWLLHRRPSPATGIAVIALIVALGGTSFAASVALPRNSVGTAQLKGNAVTSPKVQERLALESGLQVRTDPCRACRACLGRRSCGACRSDRGRGPSDAYAGFKNSPCRGSVDAVDDRDPQHPQAGNYVIFAKLWMLDNVNTSVLTDCTLVAGSDSDESRTMLEGNSGTVVAGAIVALNVVHNFAAAGAVALNCNGFGVNISINNIKITAIKVANLTNTGI